MTDTTKTMIPVTLKWGKQTFEMMINVGEIAFDFKERVQEQTGVPTGRQKLLAKKGWKGALKDDAVLLLKGSSAPPLMVTLIGSAETLKEPVTKTKFLEDLTPEDLKKQEEAELQEAIKTATGMIQVLQLPPNHRNDGKQELYQYNRLVTGLPQRQIEQELKYANNEIQGKIAMNLGLELRRAYVNDLAVLEDGTCVSVLDDGHVQLWKHATQQEDVIHPGQEGPVNSVVALHNSTFATAGRGTVQLWNSDAEPIVTLPGAMPGTTPASLTAVFNGNQADNNVTCLAARFQITRPNNPQQFRLPPQDAAERQRRAQAEAQEQAIQQALAKAARSIQVWYSVGGGGTNNLQTQILEPPTGDAAAPITCLTSMSSTAKDATSRLLIAGDTAGGIRLWKVQPQDNTLQFEHQGLYQFVGSSIVCMEPMQGNRLAVSTETSNNDSPQAGAIPIATNGSQRAVHILDLSSLPSGGIPLLQTTLTGHAAKDAVICMKELPNGDLLTGGGKLDATLQLWSKSQLVPSNDNQMMEVEGEQERAATATATAAVVVSKAHKTLTDVGYVFSIEVLPDAKKDSNYFAVAVARYNTVKIII